MGGEPGFPAAYNIKVKNGQVLYKRFLFIYGVLGPLAGARANVDPIPGFGATSMYRLVLLLGRGTPYMHILDGDADEVERARAWARRFNELSHAGRQAEPEN